MFSIFAILLILPSVIGQPEFCSCNRPLQVATLNLLQIPFAPAKQERFPQQVGLVQSSPYDALCVQELWEASEKQQFISQVASKFPYSTSPPDKAPNCSPDCSSDELDNLANCGGTLSCFEGMGAFDALSCIVDNCHDVFDDLSSECQLCLGLTSGFSVSGKLEECAGQIPLGSDDDDDIYNGCQWLYNGVSDSVLFSTIPFNQTGYYYFSISPVVVVSVAYGKIIFNNQPVNLFCTHLSAELPIINNRQPNAQQSSEIVSYIQSIAGANEAIIIMGDFNHGPSVSATNVQEQWPEGFNTIQSAGYPSTYTYLNPNSAECTFCSDNPLQSPIHDDNDDDDDDDSNNENWIIDHIYSNAPTPGIFCALSASRFATERIVPLESESVPISDHYGVQASFCFDE